MLFELIVGACWLRDVVIGVLFVYVVSGVIYFIFDVFYDS